MSLCRYNICEMYKALKRTGIFAVIACITFAVSGCGESEPENVQENETLSEDGSVDISKELDDMIARNPDVFGWLYVPGTNINYPITQNIDGNDTYYLNHEPNGMTESDKGGIYIESANLMDMCDFNTIIHGKTTADGDMFSELWNFADEEFFKEHDQFFIFLPDNTLTYEIWTAYEAPAEDTLLKYDFTEAEGCQAYLDDMKQNWTTKTNFREGWEQGVDPNNFLVTLSTVDEQYPDKQWVVVGCMVGDAAGTIDRDMSVYEE